LNGRLKRIAAHAEIVVDGDVADLAPAHARGQRGAADGEIGVLGGVEDQIVAAASGGFARGDDRVEAGCRRRIMNDPEKLLRQTQPLAQPAERDLLQLRGRGPGLPYHVIDVQRGGEHLAQNARARSGDGEVAKEARMVPVSNAGNDKLAKILQDGFHGLAALRPALGQALREISGLDVGEHWIIPDIAHVIGDPIDGLMGRRAELLGRHLLGHITPEYRSFSRDSGSS